GRATARLSQRSGPFILRGPREERGRLRMTVHDMCVFQNPQRGANPPMRQKPCLTLDDVFAMAAASRAAATALKLEATIAIVDAGGHLLYLERPDSQSANGVEMATLKAR